MNVSADTLAVVPAHAGDLTSWETATVWCGECARVPGPVIYGDGRLLIICDRDSEGRWEFSGFRRPGSAQRRAANATHRRGASPVVMRNLGEGLRQEPDGWQRMRPDGGLAVVQVGAPVGGRSPLPIRGAALVPRCQACGREFAIKRQRMLSALESITVPLAQSPFDSGERRLFIRDGEIYERPRDDLPVLAQPGTPGRAPCVPHRPGKGGQQGARAVSGNSL